MPCPPMPQQSPTFGEASMFLCPGFITFSQKVMGLFFCMPLSLFQINSKPGLSIFLQLERENINRVPVY